MSVVLDASITVAWLTKEQTVPPVTAVFDALGCNVAWVPALWWIEVANALQMGTRRKRYSLEERDAHLLDIAQFAIRTDEASSYATPFPALALSDRHRHRLTVYDATYLELALRRGLPLATLDRDLRAAALAENVPLLGL